jgi:AcrR family transcriptional regulator
MSARPGLTFGQKMSTLFSMRSEKEAKVLEAARSVFLRYGYRRTTMGDIASAAGISRPALYLLFCNKERVFEAVLRKFVANVLEEVRIGVAKQGTPIEKLRLAFELWAVQPFALMIDSPDARDLVQCGFEFADKAMMQGYDAFEALLISILETFPGPRPAGAPNLEQIAHVLTISVRGFKGAAHSVPELREMIDALLNLTTVSLRAVDT